MNSTVVIVLGVTLAIIALLKWLTRDPWGKARDYRQQAKAILRSRP